MSRPDESTPPTDAAPSPDAASPDAASPDAAGSAAEEGTRTGSARPGAEVVPGGTFVGQPAKVMRIGTMVKQLLEEVRSAPLDEAARGRLAEIHDRSLRELEDGLSPDLVAELQRISLPFSDDGNPSEPELRVAQAQLVGWLEGLFHGLQTALVAQQMAGQAQQLAQARRALPPGAVPPGGPQGGRPEEGRPDDRRAPGHYL